MFAAQQPARHLLISVRTESSSASSRELYILYSLEGGPSCCVEIRLCVCECVLTPVSAFCTPILLAVVAEERVEVQRRSDGSHGPREGERVSAEFRFNWPQRKSKSPLFSFLSPKYPRVWALASRYFFYRTHPFHACS